MAAKQISVTNGNIKFFQCYTTDAKETWPTASSCGPGSTMIVLDSTAKTVDHYEHFDGDDWYEM